MEKYIVPSLARAFEILDMLAMSSVGLTKMEIAQSLSIPYSTAFNLLNTMDRHGYVRKEESTGKYYLGLKLLSMCSIQIKDVSLRDTASPVLEELVRETGLTAHLAILDRGEAIYIDKKEPDGFLKINSWIGKRNFVHTSAVGKVLVACRSAEEIRAIWEQGLPKRTGQTITAWRKFKGELKATLQRGYALDLEEDEVGGRCIAAPVYDAAGGLTAAVGLSGIVSQIPDERIPKLAELLCARAGEISRRLGYRPPEEPLMEVPLKRKAARRGR